MQRDMPQQRDNGGYIPQDWHAIEQRATAAENRSNLLELPMNEAESEDKIQVADIRSNREAGTAEKLFNLESSKEEIFSLCAKIEEESAKKPSEEGIKGIERLLKLSCKALNVSQYLHTLYNKITSVWSDSTEVDTGSGDCYGMHQATE